MLRSHIAVPGLGLLMVILAPERVTASLLDKVSLPTEFLLKAEQCCTPAWKPSLKYLGIVDGVLILPEGVSAKLGARTLFGSPCVSPKSSRSIVEYACVHAGNDRLLVGHTGIDTE